MRVSWPGVPRWPDEPEEEAHGFVLPGTPINLAELAEVFRRLPDTTFGEHRKRGQLDVVAAFADDWMVRVSFQHGVLGDARHMATEGHLRDHPRAAEIATCDRLVTVMVADPAVSVAAFEALYAAQQWLTAQPGAIALNPHTGEPL